MSLIYFLKHTFSMAHAKYLLFLKQKLCSTEIEDIYGLDFTDFIWAFGNRKKLKNKYKFFFFIKFIVTQPYTHSPATIHDKIIFFIITLIFCI